MKKGLAIALLSCILVTSVFSSPFNLSFSVGQDNYEWWPDGISFSYGINMGLSQRFEMSLYGISKLCPIPFSENLFCAEINLALFGPMATGTRVSGLGINMLLGLGGFYNTENKGAGVMVSFVPLTVGNPMVGRRERLLKTNVGWDFINSSLLVTFSLMNLDFYVVGTYREQEMVKLGKPR